MSCCAIKGPDRKKWRTVWWRDYFKRLDKINKNPREMELCPRERSGENLWGVGEATVTVIQERKLQYLVQDHYQV